MSHVEAKGPYGDFRLQVHGVVTLFLRFEEDGSGGELERLRLVVDFAVDDLQDTDLVVIDVYFVLLRNVGQLLPGRIHLEEVRICHKVTTFGRVRDVDVALQRRMSVLGQAVHESRSGQHRRRRVRPVRIPVIRQDRVISVLEAKRLRIAVRVRIDVRMELAKEVHWLEALPIMGREVGQKAGLRRRQVEDHRHVIRCIDRHRLAAHGHVVLGLFEDVGVQHQLVMPELDVRGREWRTVGPLVPFPERERELREVVVPLP